jgi:tRNA pseudouridine55 synthase
MDQIEALARTDSIDSLLQPLELGLADLPELVVTPEGAVRLKNGNPGQVLGHLPYGEEAWASLNGQAVAVGRYMGGELHPSRVFVR